MKMKLKIWELALAITLLCGFVLGKDQAAVSDKLIRIHVVANSDSDTDQAVKLVVRDQIIAVLEPLLADCQTKDQAAAKIQAALPLLTAAARETLRQSGAADYSAVATLTQEQFPTRDYESFSLPAGEYTALRVVLGEGAGQNWWCVAFPPLCTQVVTSRDAFATWGLTEEETGLITQADTGYVIKFRILEWWEKLKSLFT